MSWAWDIDGTLVYPENGSPIALPFYRLNYGALTALSRICRALEAAPFYLTARPEALRAETQAQLRHIQAPPGRQFHMPDGFPYDEAKHQAYKESILNAITPKAMVGDTPADQAAAEATDTAYWHVDQIATLTDDELTEVATSP